MDKRCVWLSPGDPNQRTGGYLYNQRIVQELDAIGIIVEVIALPGDWPLPSAADRRRCEAVLQALPDVPVVLDGLAFGAFVDVWPQLRQRPVLALVHSPLFRETGTPPARAARLNQLEATALEQATMIVATSAAAADDIQASFSVSGVTVIQPGCDPAPLASPGDRGRLLIAGTVTPRKGYRELIAALKMIADVPWTLRCAGSLYRNPAYVAQVQQEAMSLGERVQWLGELDTASLHDAYQRTDLFILPSFYETYGMVLAEAMTAGLPIISTRGGAIPQTVPASAGVLVEPGDISGLASAIRSVLTDERTRERLSFGSRAAGKRLPDWAQQGAQWKRALQQMSERMFNG
ncbi:MAG: glycosyltransferase family 4 protein [Myxococcota bacterium]